MARPLRIEFAGAWYHVTARGNERRAIFRSDADRGRLLELLGQCGPRFGLRFHGYVLMTNHYHLIVETPQIGLSRAMQWLNGSYTVWFNRRHARSGHLFQGRFKAVLVDAQEWGAQLSRYVHLNPVRVARLGLGKAQQAERRVGLTPVARGEAIAARCTALREFRWSSYRAYIGLDRPPPWLCLEPLRSLIGGARDKARESYRAYVEEAIREGTAESPLEKVQAQVVLGSAALWQKAQELTRGGRRREETGASDLRRRNFNEVVQIVSKLKREPWKEFRDRHGDWGRDLALWLGRAHCGLKLRELGELVGGIDYSTVSVAAIRWRERSRTNQKLLRLQRRALEMLNEKI